MLLLLIEERLVGDLVVNDQWSKVSFSSLSDFNFVIADFSLNQAREVQTSTTASQTMLIVWPKYCYQQN